MFDGNYRTSQRPVTLSRRNKNASSKASILEASRRQREERLQRERQLQAAVTLQKSVRGWLTRIKFVKELENALNTAAAAASLDEHLRLLNVRLFPILMQTLSPTETTLVKWMSELAARISEYEARVAPTFKSPSPLTHFIVQTVLQLVRMHGMQPSAANCILQYCLALATSTRDQLSSATFMWKQVGWSRGYLELLETLQSMLAATNHTDEQVAALTQLLWKTLLDSTPSDKNRAIACALLLSQAKPFDASTKFLQNLSVMGDASLPTIYQVWFPAFVSNLTSKASSRDDAFGKAVQNIYKRNQANILMNAMDLYDSVSRNYSTPDPTPLILLLEQTTRQSPQLLLLCSIVARGDDVQQILEFKNGGLVAAKSMSNDDSENDDDGDYDLEVESASQPSRIAGTRTTGRLTRNELQTMTKLNRLYSSHVDKWQADVLAVLTSMSNTDMATLMELASRIGRPDVWLQWGVTILSKLSDAADQGRDAYVTLLAALLQTSTGLAPRQSSSSPLLTKLAFHQEFLEKLWRYVLVQLNNSSAPTAVLYMALSVFSDVFSHCLIALRDDQFLSQYTTMLGPRVILAEHVISQLRDLLYDMYWSRPVQAKDIWVALGTSLSPDDTLEALRGRLFITGSKLWGSLYERWCRLVRTSPFCSESAWLFPSMVTLMNDNAVAQPGQRRQNDMDVSMEIDSDSDDNDEPMSAADEENEQLADVFGDPKMARILTCIPQALPFEKRVRLFDALLRDDKAKTQDESAEMRAAMFRFTHGAEGGDGSRERISVHRENLYDDAMRQLNRLGPKLRRKVQVTFTNQHGALEAGIDGGGVFKEFIDDLISDAFVGDKSTAAHRLFKVTALETLAVNSDLPHEPTLLEHYEFCGRVLGKAIYESILVEPQFCLPFLNQLLGKSNTLEDLKNYDPEIYSNLTKLLNATTEEIGAMGLTFELNMGTGRSMRSVELVRNGGSITVTKQNAITYVHMVANQMLNAETAQATKAFLRGFRDLVPAPWVRLFSAYELQKLISGDDSIKAIDVASLKASMQYAAGYHPSQPIMQWLWEVVEEFNTDQQRKFLKFMTSCSRQPLLGFSSMAPAPCVQQIRLPDEMFIKDPERVTPLPTSSTCMNLLKLPNYRTKELLRKKLLAAIESGAGFELT
ncbi:hypothetical protein MPSEU_000197700 [Mayamaea pseudoterrestris]|nr:hypothetical protein MPSEU_000197700 [Mayamaea pseudoterrestris]